MCFIIIIFFIKYVPRSWHGRSFDGFRGNGSRKDLAVIIKARCLSSHPFVVSFLKYYICYAFSLFHPMLSDGLGAASGQRVGGLASLHSKGKSTRI